MGKRKEGKRGEREKEKRMKSGRERERKGKDDYKRKVYLTNVGF